MVNFFVLLYFYKAKNFTPPDFTYFLSLKKLNWEINYGHFLINII
jgi:hypothetical protein